MVSCVPCCCPGLPIRWGCAAECPLPPELGPKRGGALSTATGSLSGHPRGKSGCPSSPSAPVPVWDAAVQEAGCRPASPGPGGHLALSLTAGPELGAGPSLGYVQALALASPSWASCGSRGLPRDAALALPSAHPCCTHSGSDVTPGAEGGGVGATGRACLLSSVELRHLRAGAVLQRVCPVCPKGSLLCWQQQPLRVHFSARASEVAGEAPRDPALTCSRSGAVWSVRRGPGRDVRCEPLMLRAPFVSVVFERLHGPCPSGRRLCDGPSSEGRPSPLEPLGLQCPWPQGTVPSASWEGRTLRLMRPFWLSVVSASTSLGLTSAGAHGRSHTRVHTHTRLL